MSFFSSKGARTNRARNLLLALLVATTTNAASTETPIRGTTVNANDALSLVGFYPHDLLGCCPTDKATSAWLSTKIKEVVGTSNFDGFVDGIGLAGEIEKRGNYVWASGCRQHFCGDNKSAFAIDIRSGRLMAFHLEGDAPLSIRGTERGRVPVGLCQDLSTYSNRIEIFFCAPAPVSLPPVSLPPVDSLHTVFGIALERPLNVPECAKGEGLLYKAGDYAFDQQRTCWKGSQYLPPNVVDIEFTTSEKPGFLTHIPRLTLDEKGNVQAVVFYTSGAYAHQQTLKALLAKYGAPTQSRPAVVTNRVGTTFETGDLYWSFPGLHVTYRGLVYSDKIGSGAVFIETSVAKKQREAQESQRANARRKL